MEQEHQGNPALHSAAAIIDELKKYFTEIDPKGEYSLDTAFKLAEIYAQVAIATELQYIRLGYEYQRMQQ